MASNTIGNIVRLTTWGESHGYSIGGVLDGIPANLKIDKDDVQQFLNRRKPGDKLYSTSRKEPDEIVWLGGICEDGYTNGGPIAFMVLNNDAKSSEYEKLPFRIRHVDKTYPDKYEQPLQPGGGRASARTLIPQVIAGAICQQMMHLLSKPVYITVKAKAFSKYFNKELEEGDTFGGRIECEIENAILSLGEPFAHKFHAELGHHMLSINACKGFEFGIGSNVEEVTGKTLNELVKNGFYSGCAGGIMNLDKFKFTTYFQPIPTVGTTGRHDRTCILRAIPIVEAYTWLTIADLYMMHLSSNPLLR